MKILSMALLLSLVGCAAPSVLAPPILNLRATFDAAEATRLIGDGGNTIRGNAFMRQRGGGVVTCAGQTVSLVPATAYAKERIFALYDSLERGVNASRKNYTFVPDSPEYVSLVRSTKCDSQGNFLFERVADGEFYVQVLVHWQVGYNMEGGNMMHRVSVRGGQSSSVILSP
jgi:hypothetical protein